MRGFTWLRRPRIVIPVGMAVLATAVVVLAAFQPWRLFIDVTVDEELPGIVGQSESTEVGSLPSRPPESTNPSPATLPTQTVDDSPTTSRVITAEGSFISHEHPTSGRVSIITLEDGSRVLRLADLDTDNGPDLKVWLAEAPVIEGRDGWFVFDDAEYLDLGPLKGNKGNQNYPIPDDADISNLNSVTIWCDRFSVSFGAAALTIT